MQHSQPSSTVPTFASGAAPAALQRWTDRLRQAWQQLTLDSDERFVRSACDLADLEWRLQRLERGRGDRFGPFFPDA